MGFLDSFRDEVLKHAFKDALPGGKADHADPARFDPVELARGLRHELEHTNSKSLAREIAMDHLVEDPLYYRKLNAVEKKGSANEKHSKAEQRRHIFKMVFNVADDVVIGILKAMEKHP